MAHESGASVTTDKPSLTCNNQSIVYIRVQFWCYMFCGFRQMYNDMFAPLWYPTECFYSPKNPLCSAYSSLLLPNPLQSLVFILSPYFGFFQNSPCSWNHTAFSDWLLSLNMYLRFLRVFSWRGSSFLFSAK